MTQTDSAGIRLGFYGDDFTGSTDAMEVTAFAGLKTVLFTRTPDHDDLAAFADYDVVGIAGTARARCPAWMDARLPTAFEVLAALSPRVVQYKVCSTFDSAPHIGSIGRAIDIGARVVGGRWSPVIVGAPQLGRWQVFGNLFARAGAARYRIDRHPTMSCHPVTPMQEADLVRHLARQTERQIESIDIEDLRLVRAADRVREIGGDCPAVFVDVCDEATQLAAGRLVWDAGDDTLFSASSSGLQYALVAHWRDIGQLPSTPPTFPEGEAVDRLLVLSGSCSPVTAEQIAAAEARGFAAIRLDVVAASDSVNSASEIDRVLDLIEAAYQDARGVILFAAKTVDDEAFQALRIVAEKRGTPFADAQAAIGDFLGRVAAQAIPALGIRRLISAGGDTSGRIVETLPIDALEVARPLAKGAPMCRCHASSADFDGLELALKGGQIGSREFFLAALDS